MTPEPLTPTRLPGCSECGGMFRHDHSCSAYDLANQITAPGGHCAPTQDPRTPTAPEQATAHANAALTATLHALEETMHIVSTLRVSLRDGLHTAPIAAHLNSAATALMQAGHSAAAAVIYATVSDPDWRDADAASRCARDAERSAGRVHEHATDARRWHVRDATINPPPIALFHSLAAQGFRFTRADVFGDDTTTPSEGPAQ